MTAQPSPTEHRLALQSCSASDIEGNAAKSAFEIMLMATHYHTVSHAVSHSIACIDARHYVELDVHAN